MTEGRHIVRNSLWNLLGLALPLVIAFLAIPLVLAGLGTDRFAILLLAWAAVGYFNLFDFGLPRVLTQTVSAALAAGDDERLTASSQAGLGLMAAMGIAGGILFAVLAPWLAQRGLKIPTSLQPEATIAFYVLAGCVPFVVMTAGLRGLMEAHQDFAIATMLRLPYAAFNYLAPLVTIAFSPSLVPVVALLLVGRVVTWVLHLVICMRRYPYLRKRIALSALAFKPLLRLGGWMTTSNVLSPLMYNVDRFLIVNVLSLAAVAYYVTPFELVTKLTLIPSAVIGALFPAFAAAHVREDGRSAELLERAIRLMAIVMFPATLLMLAFAPEILRFWVGSTISREGSRAAQWLALGVFVNSIAQVPFTVFQSTGRPDVTAKLHLIELPLYGAALWVLMHRFGVAGVAAAWAFRMILDLAMLLAVLMRHDSVLKAAITNPFRVAGPLMVALVIPMLVEPFLSRAVITFAMLLVASVVLWNRGIRPNERELFRRLVRRPFMRARVA